MKRTGEIALTVIGGCINLLVLLIGIRLVTADYSVIRSQLQAAGEQQNLTPQQINDYIHIAQAAGNFILVYSIIIFLLTAIGLFLLLKLKMTKTSGIVLLIAGILSLPELFVPGILLLIAGIMALVRKPQQPRDAY
ncbi:DUF4064 domain-containing protein [Sporolactobacillus terrae]|uniref:DUF4064 domain-containing protein n=1 Tax=Sporolactobacillus terrae TaxID=269673 RepID=A0ABX5Q7X4_9BACL|nr:DUF4064 domain-containing protein [Sporolactobacillus terrae]QAA22762.1 DUF4064 domain-containing protein [Sporolactobacillus terrae]QAA25735.1 DUF4064 domain-containing protein [Sporolactobacillus terrae]UAK17614.1 DUF4064 domain-containing protein [Sporolactobacillus terrae]